MNEAAVTEKLRKAITAYLRIRDAIDEIQRKANEEIAPLKKKMCEVELFVDTELKHQGLDNASIRGIGKAYYKEATSVKSQDWDAFLTWVVQKEEWSMLERRAAKNAVLEFFGAEGGYLPPGLALERFNKLHITR